MTWIQTFTGKAYYPLEPRAEDVCIEDIAHSLSNLCRYAGHCREFYSVAEHSVYVSHLVPPKYAMSALLHDATEAYLVDVPRPIKSALINYVELEWRNWQAIAEHFLLDFTMHKVIKDADNAMLLAEKDVLLGPQPHPWAPITVPADMLAHAQSLLATIGSRWWPGKAETAFLERYRELSA